MMILIYWYVRNIPNDTNILIYSYWYMWNIPTDNGILIYWYVWNIPTNTDILIYWYLYVRNIPTDNVTDILIHEKYPHFRPDEAKQYDMTVQTKLQSWERPQCKCHRCSICLRLHKPDKHMRWPYEPNSQHNVVWQFYPPTSHPTNQPNLEQEATTPVPLLQSSNYWPNIRC